MSRNELYVYRASPITPERRATIVEIADGLLADASFDIENTRVTYEALIDLLGVASPGVCAEHAELTRESDVTVPIETLADKLRCNQCDGPANYFSMDTGWRCYSHEPRR